MNLTLLDLDIIANALTEAERVAKRRVEQDPFAGPSDFAEWGRIGNLRDRVIAECARQRADLSVEILAADLDAFGNPKGVPTRFIERCEPGPTPPGRVAT